MYNEDFFAAFSQTFELRRETEMSLSDFLEGCRC